MAHLDQSGSHLIIRQFVSGADSSADDIKEFSHMAVLLYLVPFLSNFLSHPGNRHKKTIGSSVSLLFHPVDRIRNLVVRLECDFLRLYLTDIVVTQFL